MPPVIAPTAAALTPAAAYSLVAPQVVSGRGYVNVVTDAGAAGDGVADDTAKINAAWAMALLSGCSSLYFPPGTYKVSDTLAFSGGASGKVSLRGVSGLSMIVSTVGVACSFTGSIAGGSLKVSAIASGAIHVGCNINTPAGWTTIVSANNDGTWAVTENLAVPAGSSMTAGAPIVLVGNGVQPGTNLIDGHVEGLTITGPTAGPTTGSTALMVCGMRHVRVTHCEVGNTTVGYDGVGNTYGLSLSESRAGFFGNCRVGWNIRGVSPTGDAGAGNQVSGYQCWLCGADAGVSISSGSDGVSIRDGQIGNTGTADTNGNVVIGNDYYTGRQGGTGVIILDGVDMEGFTAWQTRMFGDSTLLWTGSPSISYSIPGSIPLGVMRITNGGNSNIKLEGLPVRGKFRSTQPIVIDSCYPGLHISEKHTYLDPDSLWGCAANGTGGTALLPLQCQSLLATSPGVTNGEAQWIDYLTGRLMLWFQGVTITADAMIKAATLAQAADPTLDPNVGPILNPAMIRSPDGSAIATAVDPSYTQTTAAAQPILRSLHATAQLPKALPVIVFDGSNSFFNSTASAGGAQTVFVVAKFNSLAPTYQALFGSSYAGGLSLSVNGNDTLVLNSDQNVNLGNASIALDTTRYHVFVGSYANPGIWSIWYDGKKLASGSASTTLNASPSRIVGRQTNGTLLNGNVAKFVPVNAVLADAQIVAYSNWLKTEFGTP